MAEGTRFHRQHGFLPVNHAYIIRGDIYKKYPWVAFNLYAGFVKAKAVAKEKLLEQIPSALFFGADYLSMTREMIGDDPFPYGVTANQAMTRPTQAGDANFLLLQFLNRFVLRFRHQPISDVTGG